MNLGLDSDKYIRQRLCEAEMEFFRCITTSISCNEPRTKSYINYLGPS